MLMHVVAWSVIGLVLGGWACIRARRDIVHQRQRGVTFGEAHFAHTSVAVVLSSAIGAVLLYVFAQRDLPDVVIASFAYVVSSGLRLSLVDIDTHTIPHRLLFRSTAMLILLVVVSAILTNDIAFGGAMLGAVIMWCVMKVLEVLSRGDLGPADVSFAAYLGLFVGGVDLAHVPTALAAAFISGGLIALALLVIRRAGRKTHLPFGPFLFCGALVAVLR